MSGTPTTAGTHNFTIKATRSGTTCEGVRSYTVTITTTVVPILECVQRNQNGSYTARFGYNNSTGAAVTIPAGANNYFTPGNQNRGQTTVFQPGRVTNAFSCDQRTRAGKTRPYVVVAFISQTPCNLPYTFSGEMIERSRSPRRSARCRRR